MLNTTLLRTFITVSLIGSLGAASAQTLLGVKAEPASAKTGEPIKISAQFDVSQALSCHVRIHFGDGTTTSAKINQTKDALLVLSHTYDKPGSYTVMVEPKTALPMLKCTGGNEKTVVTIAAAPAPVPVAAAPQVPASAAQGAQGTASPTCPAGWKLAAKSVNKKTGAFQCTAKPGTAAPSDKPICPARLDYYESSKKGQLGCRA